MKNQTLGSNYRDNLGHQIENIVFIELLRRGYNVDVGDYSGKKIDFVASKGNEIKYYQVTEHLPEGSTRELIIYAIFLMDIKRQYYHCHSLMKERLMV